MHFFKNNNIGPVLPPVADASAFGQAGYYIDDIFSFLFPIYLFSCHFFLVVMGMYSLNTFLLDHYYLHRSLHKRPRCLVYTFCYAQKPLQSCLGTQFVYASYSIWSFYACATCVMMSPPFSSLIIRSFLNDSFIWCCQAFVLLALPIFRMLAELS